MEENVIYTRELTKRFGTFTAVDRISFNVRRGEIFGFLGANGAGKTTAMRMLCGLSVPTAGEGRVAGFDIATEAEEVKKHIGYMSQRFSLYEDLKVWENLRLFGGIYGMKDKEIARKTDEMLTDLGFESVRDTFVRALPLGARYVRACSAARLEAETRVLGLHLPRTACRLPRRAHRRCRPRYPSSVLGVNLPCGG